MAHIVDFRVRETTITTGTSDLVLDGAMQGSIAFADIMAVGDTCDYAVSYQDVFEAGRGTRAADGKLERTLVYRAKHANGAINTTKVSLPPGIKTVICTSRASKIARVDIAQAFDSTERAQHRANVPSFESGTRLIFQQTSAPIGWTKDTTNHNNKAIRLVTGTAGSGGSVDFSVLFGRTATDDTTPTTATMAAHAHTENSGGVDHVHGFTAGFASGAGGSGATGPLCINQGSSTGASSGYLHTHGINSAGSGSAHSHAIDMRVKYADAIIAVAD